MGPAALRRGAGILALAIAAAGCATAVPPKPADLVWPLPPEQPRIRYVETLYRSDQFKPLSRNWLKEVVDGPSGNQGEGMGKPYAVTTDEKGRVYVTDTGGARVWVFDREKQKVSYLGTDGQGQLKTPSGVAVDARGYIFVSDTSHDRVFAYDEAGKVVLAIGAQGEFHSPAGLAIDRATGRLYVADAGRHKVRVYDTVSGRFLFEIGERGNEPGKFNFPTHLHMKGGALYVTDTMNFRVQAFSPDGAFLRKYGEVGAAFGQFARPKGVAVDSGGNVYVTDAAFNNFQIFNQEGQLLLFVGGLGSKFGEFWLPAGIHIDERNRIYVVDQYNRRVQVFQLLGESAAPGGPKQDATR